MRREPLEVVEEIDVLDLPDPVLLQRGLLPVVGRVLDRPELDPVHVQQRGELFEADVHHPPSAAGEVALPHQAHLEPPLGARHGPGGIRDEIGAGVLAREHAGEAVEGEVLAVGDVVGGLDVGVAVGGQVAGEDEVAVPAVVDGVQVAADPTGDVDELDRGEAPLEQGPQPRVAGGGDPVARGELAEVLRAADLVAHAVVGDEEEGGAGILGQRCGVQEPRPEVALEDPPRRRGAAHAPGLQVLAREHEGGPLVAVAAADPGTAGAGAAVADLVPEVDDGAVAVQPRVDEPEPGRRDGVGRVLDEDGVEQVRGVSVLAPLHRDQPAAAAGAEHRLRHAAEGGDEGVELGQEVLHGEHAQEGVAGVHVHGVEAGGRRLEARFVEVLVRGTLPPQVMGEGEHARHAAVLGGDGAEVRDEGARVEAQRGLGDGAVAQPVLGQLPLDEGAGGVRVPVGDEVVDVAQVVLPAEGVLVPAGEEVPHVDLLERGLAEAELAEAQVPEGGAGGA